MDIDLQPMTVDALRAWEERQDAGYEADGIRPIPIAGGTFACPRPVPRCVWPTSAKASIAMRPWHCDRRALR